VLEKYGFTAAIYVITGLLGQSLRWDGLPVMTLEQLRHWASRGFEIGAHTRTHPQLTALSDAGVLEEVQGSKDDLTQAGFPLCSFAYPYGIFDDRVRESLRAIFSLALTCEEGLNDSSTDRLEMKRLMMHPSDTLLDLEFRASTGRSPLDPIRSRVRLRSRVKNALRRLKVLLRHRPM
jgi:peptidoglycan/xylan/chitin deacetylase (PgdA/CDA1 family)